MKDSRRRLRWAETIVILGLCLMAVTAVSWADGGVALPAHEPAAPPTATPTVEPPTQASPTATPGATATPAQTPAATPTPAASATVAPQATATTTATVAPVRSRRPRARPQATPTPEATPAPPSEFRGAALTICHATKKGGPYVAVTVPANQYNPHFDHEDDIIPAPSSGCDAIDDPAAAAGQAVTVCHATGSSSRPFVLLRYPNGDLGGHEDHVGDLIPAPRGTCPGLGGAAYAVPTATATATPTRSAEATVTAEPTQTPRRTGSGVRSRSAGSSATPAPEASTGTTVVERGAGLPFTGLDLGLLFALGFGLVLTGSGLRLLSHPSA